MTSFFRWLKEKFFSSQSDSELPSPRPVAELEQAIGHQFSEPDIIHLALVHRSYLTISGAEQHETNERLEFLGDAVLGMLVTEHLFHLYPTKSEGVLTQYKSVIVSRKTFALLARQLNLGDYLYLGQGEEQSGGKGRTSILSDAFEAVLGAVYIDGGYGAVKSVLERLVFPQIAEILKVELSKNYKSQLLEYAQSKGFGTPRYEIRVETGPEHDKLFEVGVQVKGQMMGVGTGKSKKKAEQAAAKQALGALDAEES